jgi:glycosyltransferase involved in cell wall biosynthesis/peptidoglycan/xylan/chitin deacetylase (PgdA/CDA1 family)
MKPQSTQLDLQEVSPQEKLQATGDLPSSEHNPSAIPSKIHDPRIHVLFLIDGILAMGGGEGALLKIVRYLPRDRFRCSLAVFKPGGRLYDLFREAGCPVHVFPVEKILSFGAVRAGWQLRRFMKREKVDIVHTFFETANLWGGLVTKLGGGPLLVSSRRDMGILRSAKHRIAYRILHPLFDSVVAVSGPVREACIRDERIASDRVITLYNGVELDKSKAHCDTLNVRVQLGLSEATHVVTSVGHIRRFKGFDVMIRAAAKVCREFPKAVFVIVGGLYETEHVRELKEMVRSLGIPENIRFAGALENVSSVLNISNVFCLLSRTEGFSNALVEAMACSLPAVATRVGGAEETIDDGRSGFLVNSEDVDTAAERILSLLRDPELARRLGNEARETVRTKFTAEIMANTLAEHYEHLLNARGSNTRTRTESKNPSRARWEGRRFGKDVRKIAFSTQHRRVRSLAKWMVIRMLWVTGALALAKWWIRRHGAVVLAFHRILRHEECIETTIQKGMIVSDESFRALLQYLQENCTTIDLDRGRQQPQQKRVQVALTFDDGWEDNASTAFPIASEFKTPLTIFICPGLLGRSVPFWPDRVSALIRSAENSSDGIRSLSRTLAAAGYRDLASALSGGNGDRADRIIDRMKTLPPERRDRVLEMLFSCGISIDACVDISLDRTMSWSQVTELSERGVTFGSHTQRHEILPLIPLARVRNEISESQEAIRTHLLKDCFLFSYPNGDASREVREEVARAGLRLAFINSPGVWRFDGDPFLIPRINVWENHLTDSRGRFSPMTFEYSVFWRAFIHRRRSRKVGSASNLTVGEGDSAVHLGGVPILQANSVSRPSAAAGGRAEKTES